MKVLGVNWADSVGSRFNGVAIRNDLANFGVDYSLAVGLKKELNESWVHSATKSQPWARRLLSFYQILERFSGFQSRYFFLVGNLTRLKAFKEADLIHIHIVHNGWFRLRSLKRISRKKAVLWTIHDPWVLTGHCVFPLGCSRFTSGCGKCPDLLSPLPVYRDRTKKEVNYKKKLIQDLDIKLHFSTNWFKNLFDQHIKVQESDKIVIPFGINTHKFAPNSVVRQKLRNSLGIHDDEMVVVIRTTSNPQKGTKFFLEALKNINRDVIVFTVDENNHLNDLIGRYSIIEFGWISDEHRMIEILNAADLLIMPSLDETFGVMALEAMACGTPVLYFKDTAIHEVVRGDEYFAMKKLQHAKQIEMHLSLILENKYLLRAESNRVRLLVEDCYSSVQYASDLAILYRNILDEKKIS
jgi:glycosyltransferase involved in cell wall biosynthesis